MQINITGHHVEVTEALNTYVLSKFEKIERHFDNITNVQVTLSVEKQRQKAEADMHVAGGQLFATHESEDMYAAIDGLSDKLDRQIIKHKEKMKKHK
ncbi:ribosome-associated translation inhibitor RaiA [Neptuniibacter sp. CAU 1671]|uniref:ribosome hibernation-promoting factor, HPF/YfiA family n=1 Tax=Neptuniibacter sp. CAU 1671 TaxID=3032593 RepID=UPI0023DB6DFD|nr:ribosome-associated translation inhibitor RaiA [Neptuniibacter sp. CAU 1671]MDF2182190.1 ribosome-associated translation inhibitor RaiA [Neptuniibacter sp. CAU 1671]